MEKKKQEGLMDAIKRICSFERKKGEKYIEIIVATMDDDDVPSIFYELLVVC